MATKVANTIGTKRSQKEKQNTNNSSDLERRLNELEKEIDDLKSRKGDCSCKEKTTQPMRIDEELYPDGTLHKRTKFFSQGTRGFFSAQ